MLKQRTSLHTACLQIARPFRRVLQRFERMRIFLVLVVPAADEQALEINITLCHISKNAAVCQISLETQIQLDKLFQMCFESS